MATAIKAILPVSTILLASAALASCGGGGGGNASAGNGGSTDTAVAEAQVGKLFSTDFKGVCSGAGVEKATAYDKAAATHKALYFATHKDDFGDRSSSLPDGWTVQFSPDTDAYRAVDLVVCARRTAAREVKICDEYQDDGKASQTKVRWHTATYELSVREARTGRTLAQTNVDATSTTCPMIVMSDGGTEIVDDYASPSDTAVADVLRPHITR